MMLAQALAVVRGTCLTLPWLAHLFIADILLSALLPLSVVAPSLTYHVSSRIAESVWAALQFIFTGVNGAVITQSGAKIPLEESAIVVSNHVSWVDVYMIQAVAIRANMLRRCRYLAKAPLKWVPFLGWGLWAMGMPLVNRNWTSDRGQLDQAFGKILRNRWPIWLISYSEGTRFTQKKRAATIEWCKKHDKPVLQHTLYPRTKGFVATVNELRKSPDIRAVYDITIAYARGNRFQDAPDFWQSLSRSRIGDTWRCHVHVDRHLISELPTSQHDLAEWLEARWVDKDRLLERLRDQLSKGISWA